MLVLPAGELEEVWLSSMTVEMLASPGRQVRYTISYIQHCILDYM